MANLGSGDLVHYPKYLKRTPQLSILIFRISDSVTKLRLIELDQGSEMMPYPKLAALAVVIRKQELLLVRRKNEPDANLWGFPGGHVEFGETVGDAACRELAEETSVRARPLNTLLGLEAISAGTHGKTDFHFYLVAVACAYISGEPEARDDVCDARWIAHEDVFQRRLPLSEDVDTVLELALRHQDTALNT